MGQKYSTTYEIADVNEFVVTTGWRVKDGLKVSKSTMKFPFQKASRINVQPHNYEFSLHAMSCEKLQFVLPGVFTIGPYVDGGLKELEKYATYLGNADEKSRDDTIKGVIEGEVRVQSAQLTLEDIFKDRVAFKKHIIDGIQTELDQFGLKVFNANIKELEDAHGSEYFSYMRQKTRSSAENEAKINIADANNRGTVAVNEKENTTKIQLAQIKAKTIMAENAQKQSVLSSNAELVLATANQESQTQIQQAEIQRRTEQSIFENNTSLALAKTERDSELRIKQAEIQLRTEQASFQNATALVMAKAERESQVEVKRAEMLRRTQQGAFENETELKLLKTEREADIKVKQAEIQSRTTTAENKQKQAIIESNTALNMSQVEQDNVLKMKKTELERELLMAQTSQEQDVLKKRYELEREAEKIRQEKRLEELRATKGADAIIHAEIMKVEADARFYSKQKEAEGIMAIYNAHKQGLSAYSEAFALNPETNKDLLSYLMLERDVYNRMAETNAKAIQDLNPKITVWNTGSDNGDGKSDPFASFRNIFQCIPPLMGTLQQQSDFIPPTWLANSVGSVSAEPKEPITGRSA